MAVSNPNKTVDVESISCTGKANVKISFDASSSLQSRPADIVLVIDTSYSMNGQKLQLAKNSAKKLINLVAKASGGTENELIGNNSRVGLVNFSSTATVVSQLTDNVSNLRIYINNLNAGGETNHEDAFIKAKSVLDFNSPNDKIIIMFTDGIRTRGNDPVYLTDELKKSGAEIFCIGLVDDPKDLNAWASEPLSTHVSWDNDIAVLEEIFEKIAYETIKAGAYDVVINEKLNPDFKILNIKNVTDGEVKITDPQSFTWEIPAVGVGQNEKVSVEFEIMHIGKSAGIKEVNSSISYSDRAGDKMEFPNPTINVQCGGNIVNPEICPNPTEFTVEGCKDAAAVTTLDINLQSLGRVIQVDVPIKNVCPNKRAAAAVILSEVDAQGVEHARGLKTVLIPALSGTSCQDILLKCISFVVPETLDETGSKTSICNERKFKVRAAANYIDTDFVCCDPKTVIVK